MDRRKFGVEAARILLGGAAIVISGCGSNTMAGPTAVATPAPSAPPVTDKTGSISSNHNHSAVIAAAVLLSGGGLELDIKGTASHTHTVSLTASEVASIRQGVTVAKESSATSHSHMVTFNA